MRMFKEIYCLLDMVIACLAVSAGTFLFLVVFFTVDFPKNPEFTRHIENTAAVKFMTPDHQYYYAVDEKIGNQTRKVILKPILTIDADGANISPTSSGSDL